jgi:integrase
MARIYKRCECGERRWTKCEHAYWYQWRGERKTLTVSSKPAADAAFAEVQRRAVDPSYRAAHETSLAAVLELWLAALPTLRNRSKPMSPATLEMYGYHVGHFVRIVGGDTPIALVDAAAIDRYVATRRSETIGGTLKKPSTKRVSPHTVSKELYTWGQVLGFAYRRGLTSVPPDRVLPDTVAAEYVPLERALTWEQVPVLLAGLPEPRAATCAFIVGLGADWACVEPARPEDFDAGSVLLRGSKNYRRWQRVPIVPPFEPCVAFAAWWLERNGSFPAWGNATRDLAAVCARLELPRVTPRDLRRTFGRVLRARGVEPQLIGPLLRHADGRMAERVYAGLGVDDLGRLVREATT